MTPRDYYYKYFRKDFQKFISVNPPHKHPDGEYLSIQQLSTEKVVSAIGKENLEDFYCSMAFTVLIDQLMHSHFPYDSKKFEAITMYPKIELGISNTLVHPWRVVAIGVSDDKFNEYADFFIKDYEEFFTKQHFQRANWDSVKKALIEDKDVNSTKFGKIFIDKLSFRSK